MIEFPSKKYNIIYADPPWEVKRGPIRIGKGSLRKGCGPSQLLPYSTMSFEEIKNIPVNQISEKNSHLYLWVINKYIPEGYKLAKYWGFNVSCLLTWCKPKHGLGLGGAFVQTTEHLLFCRKGILPTKKRIDTTYFHHKRLSHSTKPQFFRDMIVEVSGNLPRIELFSRSYYEGWDVWGNEVSQNKIIESNECVR